MEWIIVNVLMLVQCSIACPHPTKSVCVEELSAISCENLNHFPDFMTIEKNDVVLLDIKIVLY